MGKTEALETTYFWLVEILKVASRLGGQIKTGQDIP
jgi:hypothetical protein